jgi:hypothetical protein
MIQTSYTKDLLTKEILKAKNQVDKMRCCEEQKHYLLVLNGKVIIKLFEIKTTK